MTNLLNILVSIAIPLWLGYLLTTLLISRDLFKMLPRLAIGYGLGIGVLSQIMLFLGMLEIPLELNTIRPLSLCFIILLTIYYLIKMRKSISHQEIPHISFNPSIFQRCIILLMYLYIGYNILFILWRTLYFPIQNWDAIATIGFKAKAIFFDHSIHRLNLPWGSYPLLVPFSESWTAFNLNYWDDILIKTPFPLFSISFLIIQYSFVKNLTDKLYGLLSTCLTLSSSFYIIHSGIGYRDIVISYYTCTSVILLLLWNKYPEKGLLILSSLFTGLVTFTKLEGTGYLFIFYLLFLFILLRKKSLNFKNKINHSICFFLPSFSICFVFHLYKYFVKVANMAQRTQFIDPNEIFLRFLTTWKVFLENFFSTGNWNLIWFLLGASIFLRPKRLENREEIKLISITLAMFFLLYLFISTFTIAFLALAGEASSTVLSRVILHFFPLAPILIALLNYKKTRNEQTPTP